MPWPSRQVDEDAKVVLSPCGKKDNMFTRCTMFWPYFWLAARRVHELWSGAKPKPKCNPLLSFTKKILFLWTEKHSLKVLEPANQFHRFQFHRFDHFRIKKDGLLFPFPMHGYILTRFLQLCSIVNDCHISNLSQVRCPSRSKALLLLPPTRQGQNMLAWSQMQESMVPQKIRATSQHPGRCSVPLWTSPTSLGQLQINAREVLARGATLTRWWLV